METMHKLDDLVDLVNLVNLVNSLQIIENKHYFNKQNVKKIIDSGTYCFISSESLKHKRSEIEENKRFYDLGNIINDKGFPIRQVVGSYNKHITKFSYFVIKPNDVSKNEFYNFLFKLGQTYNQESIILASEGIAKLIFTTNTINYSVGQGYEGCGFKITTDDNYTIIKCDKNYDSSDNDSDYKLMNYGLTNQCIIIGQYNFNYNNLVDIMTEIK